LKGLKIRVILSITGINFDFKQGKDFKVKMNGDECKKIYLQKHGLLFRLCRCFSHKHLGQQFGNRLKPPLLSFTFQNPKVLQLYKDVMCQVLHMASCTNVATFEILPSAPKSLRDCESHEKKFKTDKQNDYEKGRE